MVEAEWYCRSTSSKRLFLKTKTRQQVALSDSFTSSLLSYPNMPLTAVRICYRRTYNRAMVCVCFICFAFALSHSIFRRGGACSSRNIIVIIINNSKAIRCKNELHFYHWYLTDLKHSENHKHRFNGRGKPPPLQKEKMIANVINSSAKKQCGYPTKRTISSLLS